MEAGTPVETPLWWWCWYKARMRAVIMEMEMGVGMMLLGGRIGRAS